MIDIDLINQPPSSDNFKFLDIKDYPFMFLGFIIRNKYDDLRINVVNSYNPVNLYHLTKDRKSVTSLKGLKLTPNSNTSNLIKTLILQEKIGINLNVYQNLLEQHGLSCKETYSLFDEGFYPIDFVNLKSVCNDSFNTDKKIFQHILGLDENVFDFQKFSSLKLFILTI